MKRTPTGRCRRQTAELTPTTDLDNYLTQLACVDTWSVWATFVDEARYRLGDLYDPGAAPTPPTFAAWREARNAVLESLARRKMCARVYRTDGSVVAITEHEADLAGLVCVSTLPFGRLIGGPRPRELTSKERMIRDAVGRELAQTDGVPTTLPAFVGALAPAPDPYRRAWRHHPAPDVGPRWLDHVTGWVELDTDRPVLTAVPYDLEFDDLERAQARWPIKVSTVPAPWSDRDDVVLVIEWDTERGQITRAQGGAVPPWWEQVAA